MLPQVFEPKTSVSQNNDVTTAPSEYIINILLAICIYICYLIDPPLTVTHKQWNMYYASLVL